MNGDAIEALLRIADALERLVEWFIDGPHPSETVEVDLSRGYGRKS